MKSLRNALISLYTIRHSIFSQSPSDRSILSVLFNEGVDLSFLDNRVGVIHIAMVCLISTNATNYIYPFSILRKFPIA